MKYYVEDRGDPLSVSLSEEFHTLAQHYGLQLDKEMPQIVISIGGDGTMLKAFHHFIDQIEHIAFIGIHTGHLGFYADWKKEELNELVQLLQEHDAPHKLQSTIAQYPLIQLDIHTRSIDTTYIALNEFTLKSMNGTLVAEIHINGVPFEMFRGDGICVSTPSGSTAYNKAIGGAMIHPSIEALQIAEIASINNRVFRTLGSALILPKHHNCDIYSRKEQPLLLTVDHQYIPIQDLQSVHCKVHCQKVSFARLRPYPFWNRVRAAFLD